MRTTIDLDDDLMRKLADRAGRSGRSLEQTLNEVISLGLGETSHTAPGSLPLSHMRQPLHPIDRTWEIEAEMDLDNARHALEKST